MPSYTLDATWYGRRKLLFLDTYSSTLVFQSVLSPFVILYEIKRLNIRLSDDQQMIKTGQPTMFDKVVSVWLMTISFAGNSSNRT